MADSPIEADYLVVGAGAVGMAFADQLLSESEATIAIVDQRHRPGGHWNDAYPFVRLHQPSSNYGVNSRPLGSGGKDTAGFNAGLDELASGAEVVAYFEAVMQQRLLPSGRVRYFPVSEYTADGCVVSRLSGARRPVAAGKVVDATRFSPNIPATRPPLYEVAEGVVVEQGAVISMGVFLGASTKIVDRATGEVMYGRVPAYSVVVPGTLSGKDGGPNLACAVIVKRVDAKTRSKTGINELLRD